MRVYQSLAPAPRMSSRCHAAWTTLMSPEDMGAVSL